MAGPFPGPIKAPPNNKTRRTIRLSLFALPVPVLRNPLLVDDLHAVLILLDSLRACCSLRHNSSAVDVGPELLRRRIQCREMVKRRRAVADRPCAGLTTTGGEGAEGRQLRYPFAGYALTVVANVLLTPLGRHKVVFPIPAFIHLPLLTLADSHLQCFVYLRVFCGEIARGG